MEFKDAQYFVKVVEAGSIGLAADELRTARPALSRHIKKIEEYAGTDLFLRLPRGVKLTGAGHVFLGHCRRILQEVASAEMALRNLDSASGQIVLGITPQMAAVIAAPLIEKIGKRFPDVSVKVLAASSETLIAHLLDGFADIGFLVTGAIDAFHVPRLKLIPLCADRLVVVSALEQDRDRTFYTAEELGHQRIILNICAGTLLRQQTPGLYEKLSFQCETDSDDMVRSLVLRQQGITLCPLRVYHEDIEQGRMKAFPISDVHVYVTLGLAYLEDRLSHQALEILRITETQVHDLISQGVIVSESLGRKSPTPISGALSQKHVSTGLPRPRRRRVGA